MTLAKFDTPYVLVAARTFVDPADLAAVNALQLDGTWTFPSLEPS